MVAVKNYTYAAIFLNYNHFHLQKYKFIDPINIFFSILPPPNKTPQKPPPPTKTPLSPIPL